MIHYVQGDATDPSVHRPVGTRIIAHVCNDVGAWGSGFVMAVSRRYPRARSSYKHAIRKGLKLGGVDFCFMATERVVIANMIAQRGIGRGERRVLYGPLRRCLRKVAHFARPRWPAVSIHMPRIGCGLGGGKWPDVEPILKDELGDFDVFVYGGKR